MRVDADVPTADGIARFIQRLQSRDRLPTADIIPVEGCLNHGHVVMAFHDGVVDRFADDLLELGVQHFLEPGRSHRITDRVDVRRHLGLVCPPERRGRT